MSKLGIFDSGLGGILITKAVRAHIPDIDILYFGDTLHLPYGNRSDEAIYRYTKASIDFMFESGCTLIVLACNTASAAALRRLQQTYIADAWPGRNVIGVVVPTLEVAIEQGYKNLGLIGTNYIVHSKIYEGELTKLDPTITLSQMATPLLVPLIENRGEAWIQSVLETYLTKLQNTECLILGCTHYPSLKAPIRDILGADFPILSQDEIIPQKLNQYLKNHPEYTDKIEKNHTIEFFISDLTDNYQTSASTLYGAEINLQHVEIHS